MSFDGEEMRWICGRAGVVNLRRVSSMVRGIRDPCLHQSPTQGSKALKREKWHTVFDSEGKALGFRKILKHIKFGGVDPSIRPEVWEFLLGCYALSSSAEYRRELRTARRERYEDLVRQCQSMHSGIGSGTLYCAVGSKEMDMRTSLKDSDTGEATNGSSHASHDTANKINAYTDSHSGCTDMSYTHLRQCSRNAAELMSVRASTEGAAYNSSHLAPLSGISNCFPTGQSIEMHEQKYDAESFLDSSSLPVTNLLKNGDMDMNGDQVRDHRTSFSENARRDDDEHMHCFQISNNVDLIMESNASSSNLLHARNSETHSFSSDEQNYDTGSNTVTCNTETVNGIRILDAPKTVMKEAATSNGRLASEDRVSEWLWTLHRIVVDVVRTDNHLDFYKDAKNMARMSDILAVYAWVDPATGYCQGMSDLLSPFVVLYEDNSDAFWCFEFLMRRMRENFQMEGPTGVMKQLQALWKILELTDSEMYGHLSAIGAESLHFAFRMLLVLFRRELSFDEALCMWEMMWAADFNENIAQQLEGNCLELLVLHLRENTFSELRKQNCENGIRKSGSPKTYHNYDDTCSPYSNGLRSISTHPFCGLTKANIWSRNDQLPVCTSTVSTRNGDDKLPVFCVAAILIINRQKIMTQTRTVDDVIKMFNDNKLKINVKRCVHTAIKLRKKYFYKDKLLLRSIHVLWRVS